MAKSHEILTLVDAHFRGDHEKFKSTVLAIAANSDNASPRLARDLRMMAARPLQAARFVELPQHVANMLTNLSPAVGLSDLIVDDSTRARIDRVLLEQRKHETLFAAGFSPMRKLLFIGPPGVGKTMTAQVLAHELQLPMFRVELHGVIASHLGETASKLAQVFSQIRAVRAVYLFDEVDALAPERGGTDRYDVAEMRRVVNSLLQFIENDDSQSIIVAATNHVALLDHALFRRFDDIVPFPLPTADVGWRVVARYISKNLSMVGIDLKVVGAAAAGIGHADIAAACMSVSKDAILADRGHVNEQEIVLALRRRAEMSERSRTVLGDGSRDSQEASADPDDDEGSRVDRGDARAPVEDAGLLVRDHGDQVHHRQ